MQQPQTEEKPTKEKDPTAEERTRILTQILANKDKMTSEYKQLVKHTGSLVSSSMAYAYSKAFNDVFKLIAKGAKNEKVSE